MNTAKIEQLIRHANFEKDVCATYEMVGESRKWIQYGDKLVNAAYPFTEHPGAFLNQLGGELVQWQSSKYLTVRLVATSPQGIAQWINSYFTRVLLATPSYELTYRVARFKCDPVAQLLRTAAGVDPRFPSVHVSPADL